MKLPPDARLNGFDIVFPVSGPLPTYTFPGYRLSPTDPYRYILEYKPCKYRKLNIETKCLCPLGHRIVDHCVLIGLYINPNYCQICMKREE